MHVVATHDGGENRLYVDGVLEDTVTQALWTHAAQPMHIGRKGTDERQFFFRGAIDDVRVYDRALESEDVRALLNESGWQPARREPIAGDPLSGRWGHRGIVFLDLRYDGRAVYGQIMAGRPDNMARIAKGEFDHRTGAIHLEGDATHPETGAPVRWRIAATLDGPEIVARASFNGHSDNYFLSRRGARLRLSKRSIRSQLGALALRIRRWTPRIKAVA